MAKLVPVLGGVLLVAAAAAAQQEQVLVSVKNGDHDGTLVAMNPDGSAQAALFTFQGLPSTQDGDIGDIALSPSGRYIAMDSDHDRWNNPERRNIYLVGSDGQNWSQVTPAPNADDYFYQGPTGSISGTVTWESDPVAFATVTCQGVAGEFTSDGSGNYTISDVPPGTKMVFAFTWGGAEIVWGWALAEVVAGMEAEAHIVIGYSEPWERDECSDPVWAPDEATLYYKSYLAEGVYRTEVPGDWSANCILDDDWGLWFSGYDVRRSDGKIVFAADEGTWAGIATADPDGSNKTLLYPNTGEITVSFPADPRWSPDGQKISFRGSYADPVVCVIDATTGSVEAWFCFEGENILNYGWSPDGQYVLVGNYDNADPDAVYLWKVEPYQLADYAQLYGPANIVDAEWEFLNPIGVGDEEDALSPAALRLSVWPSPFSASCAIRAPGCHTADVFDVAGRLVAVLDISGGRATWEPDQAASCGLYVIRARGSRAESLTGSVLYLR